MLKPPHKVIVRIKMGSPGEPLTSICRDRAVTWICLLTVFLQGTLYPEDTEGMAGEGFRSQTSFVVDGKSGPEHPCAKLRGNLFLL